MWLRTGMSFFLIMWFLLLAGCSSSEDVYEEYNKKDVARNQTPDWIYQYTSPSTAGNKITLSTRSNLLCRISEALTFVVEPVIHRQGEMIWANAKTGNFDITNPSSKKTHRFQIYIYSTEKNIKKYRRLLKTKKLKVLLEGGDGIEQLGGGFSWIGSYKDLNYKLAKQNKTGIKVLSDGQFVWRQAKNLRALANEFGFDKKCGWKVSSHAFFLVEHAFFTPVRRTPVNVVKVKAERLQFHFNKMKFGNMNLTFQYYDTINEKFITLNDYNGGLTKNVWVDLDYELSSLYKMTNQKPHETIYQCRRDKENNFASDQQAIEFCYPIIKKEEPPTEEIKVEIKTNLRVKLQSKGKLVENAKVTARMFSKGKKQFSSLLLKPLPEAIYEGHISLQGEKLLEISANRANCDRASKIVPIDKLIDLIEFDLPICQTETVHAFSFYTVSNQKKSPPVYPETAILEVRPETGATKTYQADFNKTSESFTANIYYKQGDRVSLRVPAFSKFEAFDELIDVKTEAKQYQLFLKEPFLMMAINPHKTMFKEGLANRDSAYLFRYNLLRSFLKLQSEIKPERYKVSYFYGKNSSIDYRERGALIKILQKNEAQLFAHMPIAYGIIDPLTVIDTISADVDGYSYHPNNTMRAVILYLWAGDGSLIKEDELLAIEQKLKKHRLKMVVGQLTSAGSKSVNPINDEDFEYLSYYELDINHEISRGTFTKVFKQMRKALLVLVQEEDEDL